MTTAAAKLITAEEFFRMPEPPRWLEARELTTRPGGTPPQAFGRFTADAVNEIWTADLMNGPQVAGKATFLAGIIDDRSRFLTGARFVRRQDALHADRLLRRRRREQCPPHLPQRRSGEVVLGPPRGGGEPLMLGQVRIGRLDDAADLSAVLIDSKLPDPGLTYFIAQLEADPNLKKLPVLILAIPDNGDTRELLERYAKEQARLDFLISQTREFRRDRQAAHQTDETPRPDPAAHRLHEAPPALLGTANPTQA